MIRWNDFEFEDRVDLLEEGLAIIQEELPDPSKRKVGIPFGATVARFNSGKTIVADAKAALAEAKVAQSLLTKFTVAVEVLRGPSAERLWMNPLIAGEQDYGAFQAQCTEVANIFDEFYPLEKEFQAEAKRLFGTCAGDLVAMLYDEVVMMLVPLEEGDAQAGFDSVKAWARPLITLEIITPEIITPEIITPEISTPEIITQVWPTQPKQCKRMGFLQAHF